MTFVAVSRIWWPAGTAVLPTAHVAVAPPSDSVGALVFPRLVPLVTSNRSTPALGNTVPVGAAIVIVPLFAISGEAGVKLVV